MTDTPLDLDAIETEHRRTGHAGTLLDPHCAESPDGRLPGARLVFAVTEGIINGLNQPDELTSGTSWDDCDDALEMAEAHDQAVNVAQAIARLVECTLGEEALSKLAGAAYLDGGLIVGDVLRDAGHNVPPRALYEADRAAEEAATLRMLGVVVVWHYDDREYDEHGELVSGYAPGWVAQARLSDGTYSWPMGAIPRVELERAILDARHVVWREGQGPQMAGPCEDGCTFCDGPVTASGVANG